MTGATTREIVVVSGYYGFDNLGDEAILEELTNELKRLVSTNKIIVLSEAPQKTSQTYGVRSEERMDLLRLIELFRSAKLFVSGGGGLFQDTRSVGSALYYGMQIMLAKSLGAKVVVYAQGLGPLNRPLSKWMTRRAFAQCDAIAVRDSVSHELLESWQIPSQVTADPVWCLESKPLPEAVHNQLNAIKSSKLVGLSLRESPNFSDQHLNALVEGLAKALPTNAHVLLLPLQPSQDRALLDRFATAWSAKGRECTLIDTSPLILPSQWIALFGRCKLVVAMRLHALIMSLKAGVGVVGIDYDPKVSRVLSEFEQPALNLTKDADPAQWETTLVNAFADWEKLARRAMKKAEGAKKLACQNFNLLATILNVQKHG